jgi:hypothetical protein
MWRNVPVRLRHVWSSIALLALCGGIAASSPIAAQSLRVSKPRPAPPGPSSMPPLAPAVLDPTLEIGGEEVEADKVETRMTVDVKVNDRGPYKFVVDSGADTSVVGLKIARDLQLPLGTPAVLNNMTDRNIVDRVKLASLSLGPSTIRDLQVPALREQDLGGHGLIGIDALVRQRLMMDFDERVIKVEDARKPYKAGPDEIVVIGKLQRGQLILTQVRAGRVPLDAVIDTGSEITIGNIKLRDQLMKSRRNKVWTVAATGVTGKTIDLQLGRIKELKVGTITLRDVPIAFADLPPFEVFGMADQPALLLGTDLLELFRRVSLDFHARKARFQLRRCGTFVATIGTSPTSALTRLSDSASTNEYCG